MSPLKQNKLRLLDPSKIIEAERQILEYSRTVKFTVTEYSFEFIVEKLNNGRYYVPEYQRELTWSIAKQSMFIESIFMGLPIPFVFFWQDKGGRMEIVDGSQRLRTIRDFMSDKFALRDLDTIPAANNLRYSDFSEPRRWKFAETSIRVIILDNATDEVTRTEMFARINTGGTNANDAEIRRGSLPGEFMNLVIELSVLPRLQELTPINKQLIDKREREELVTRFFAYLNSFEIDDVTQKIDIVNYKEQPRKFFFEFIKKYNEVFLREVENDGISKTKEKWRVEFNRMLMFIEKISPNGFTKSETGSQVPRVRFEALAVGSALALRQDPSLFDGSINIQSLLESDAFDKATKSDAANIKTKLVKRINLVREWLLTK